MTESGEFLPHCLAKLGIEDMKYMRMEEKEMLENEIVFHPI